MAPTHPAIIVHCLKRLERIGVLQESGSKPGSMSRWASERAAFEASLREAEQRGELAVCYQPRVDAKDGALLGMECLVRWNHPQFGCVPPDQFIPLAEETGLIVSIGEWVLREACTQTQYWRDQGFPDVRVSVNLSAVQFQDADLFSTVQRALKDSGLPAQWLELEVTESTLMGDPSATALTLENLKSLGVHLSIDDFGTGYSSLSYLKRFPIDALKIDRSFVDEVTTNPDDAAIATAIVLMGHSLRLRVVGEGVETTDQQTLLRLLGCDEIQGYLISPPIPAERFEERFLGRNREVA
jgi:EAL domain-containing protein (putative c-di-GMP-specific phosphodiesterase class I)